MAFYSCVGGFLSASNLCRLILLSLLFFLTSHSHAAVILQYHHVGSETPRLTSTSADEFVAHLDWLKNNDFKILPLPQLIILQKEGKLSVSEKIAAITFDDAYASVCDTAWPILKKRDIPFTLFVSTSAVTPSAKVFCGWNNLREMHRSGLLTVGNHSHAHEYFLHQKARLNHNKAWKADVVLSITRAQQIIDNELGMPQEKLFVYPYGEFNSELKSIVKKLGYVAFGQQSGAVGPYSDLLALPRFPLEGDFASIDRFPEKMLSLPLPAAIEYSVDNPVMVNSTSNPPNMLLTLAPYFNYKLQCFLGDGTIINIQKHDGLVNISSGKKLPVGRSRYTCTADSDEKGRFYWLSHQWVIN